MSQPRFDRSENPLDTEDTWSAHPLYWSRSHIHFTNIHFLFPDEGSSSLPTVFQPSPYSNPLPPIFRPDCQRHDDRATYEAVQEDIEDSILQINISNVDDSHIEKLSAKLAEYLLCQEIQSYWHLREVDGTGLTRDNILTYRAQEFHWTPRTSVLDGPGPYGTAPFGALVSFKKHRSHWGAEAGYLAGLAQLRGGGEVMLVAVRRGIVWLLTTTVPAGWLDEVQEAPYVSVSTRVDVRVEGPWEMRIGAGRQAYQEVLRRVLDGFDCREAEKMEEGLLRENQRATEARARGEGGLKTAVLLGRGILKKKLDEADSDLPTKKVRFEEVSD